MLISFLANEVDRNLKQTELLHIASLKVLEKFSFLPTKQRIGLKFHTFSLIRSLFRIQENLRDQAALPTSLCIFQSWQDYLLH